MSNERTVRFLVLLAVFLVAGCFNAESVTESAHAVFVTRPDCPYLIAKTPGAGYAVLQPSGDYTPRRGDLLVGNLQRGGLALGVVPFGTNDLEGSEQFEVVQHSLSLAEAQATYYGQCPPPALGAGGF